MRAVQTRLAPAAFGRIAIAIQSADDIPGTVAAAGLLAGGRESLVGVFHVDSTPLAGTLYPAVSADRGIETPAEARALVAAAVEALRASSVEASGTILEADGRVLAAPLLEAFTRFRADLVITRSRGLGPLSAIARGSVSHRLIHGARRPVLSIPPGCLGLSLSRIAVGSNATPQARAAAALAGRLARIYGGEVIELAVRPGRGAGAADALNAAAEEVGATLLVIGHRGHGDLAAALLGSTGFRLLEITQRPVLLVRQSS